MLMKTQKILCTMPKEGTLLVAIDSYLVITI